MLKGDPEQRVRSQADSVQHLSLAVAPHLHLLAGGESGIRGRNNPVPTCTTAQQGERYHVDSSWERMDRPHEIQTDRWSLPNGLRLSCGAKLK
jgi:hypothetical protein